MARKKFPCYQGIMLPRHIKINAIFVIKTGLMDVQANLKWIQQELESVEDPAFLMVIKNMLEYRKKMVQSQRISVEQYNKEIDEAIEDVKAGRVHTHEQVKETIKQWGAR